MYCYNSILQYRLHSTTPLRSTPLHSAFYPIPYICNTAYTEYEEMHTFTNELGNHPTARTTTLPSFNHPCVPPRVIEGYIWFFFRYTFLLLLQKTTAPSRYGRIFLFTEAYKYNSPCTWSWNKVVVYWSRFTCAHTRRRRDCAAMIALCCTTLPWEPGKKY